MFSAVKGKCSLDLMLEFNVHDLVIMVNVCTFAGVVLLPIADLVVCKGGFRRMQSICPSARSPMLILQKRGSKTRDSIRLLYGLLV